MTSHKMTSHDDVTHDDAAVHTPRTRPRTRAQVYERTKAPLLTLMAGGSSETVYCILKHLEGMLPRCPGVFDDEYRQFFTRWDIFWCRRGCRKLLDVGVS